MAFVGDPPDVYQVSISGYSDTIPGSEELIWGGGTQYIYLNDPSSAQPIGLSSSLNADGTSGDGAQCVLVHGVDSSFVETIEVVSLDGRTQRFTDTEYYRVYRLEVCSAGASDENEGVIYAGTSGATNGVPNSWVFARIESGDGKNLAAHWTIPASYTGQVLDFWAAAGKDKDSQVSLHTRRNGAPWHIQDRRKMYRDIFIHPAILRDQEIPAGTDLEIRGKNLDAQDTEMSAGMAISFSYKI